MVAAVEPGPRVGAKLTKKAIKRGGLFGIEALRVQNCIFYIQQAQIEMHLPENVHKISLAILR